MSSRYKVGRTRDGWWVVKTQRWLRWKSDDFMYSTRELAEDRLGDLLKQDARLTRRWWRAAGLGTTAAFRLKGWPRNESY
jgi:hypothetical protein